MTTLEEIQMEASSLTAENVQEVLAYIHELKTRRAVQEAGISRKCDMDFKFHCTGSPQ